MKTFTKSLLSVVLAAASISAFALPIHEYAPAFDKDFSTVIKRVDHPDNFVFGAEYTGPGVVSALNDKAIRVHLDSGKTIRLADTTAHFDFVVGDKVQVTQTKPGNFELEIDGPAFVSIPVCANTEAGRPASDKIFTMTSTVVRDALLAQPGCFTQNKNSDFVGSAVTLTYNKPRGVFDVVLGTTKTTVSSFYVSRESAGNKQIAKK